MSKLLRRSPKCVTEHRKPFFVKFAHSFLLALLKWNNKFWTMSKYKILVPDGYVRDFHSLRFAKLLLMWSPAKKKQNISSAGLAIKT